MTVRKTSIEVYHRIKSEGLLSKRRWEVYDYVYRNGPCTAKDILVDMLPQGCASGTYSGRFSELKRMGVLIEVGTTRCRHTGNQVYLWDVTDKLPDCFKNDIPKPFWIAENDIGDVRLVRDKDIMIKYVNHGWSVMKVKEVK